MLVNIQIFVKYHRFGTYAQHPNSRTTGFAFDAADIVVELQLPEWTDPAAVDQESLESFLDRWQKNKYINHYGNLLLYNNISAINITPIEPSA